MLGAATRSFINTEPGALWELPSALYQPRLHRRRSVWIRRTRIIFYGRLIEPEEILAFAGADMPA